MNAISVSRHHYAGEDADEVHDVDACIRSWGRRGILFGGLIGFILGAICVANPFAAGGLTFGIIGTFMICAIECAAVAGGLAVLMAALHGQGVLRCSTAGLEQTLAPQHPTEGVNWREEDVPLPVSNATW